MAKLSVNVILPPDLFVNRPSAVTVKAGPLFYATDKKTLYRSNGTTWDVFSGEELAILSNGSIAFTADQSMGSHKLTNVTDPTSAQDAATKAYVDAYAVGLNWKQAVRLATTVNDSLSGLAARDGVTPVANDRVLVQAQTAGAGNGIYVAAAGAWSRAADADTSAEVKAGMAVFVNEGTLYGDKALVLTTNDPITLGTTALVFAQFSGTSGVIKADGTVAFTADQSMGSHKLTNVTDPTSAQDAATKAYVDSQGGLARAPSFTQFSAGASGTNAIPMDDTVPQITEGDEYMTKTWTPLSATNWLRIDVIGVWWPNNSPWWITAALFQDATANALASMIGFLNGANAIAFTYWMLAGTTSATTFRVRAGRHSAAGASIYFNGDGARRMGGTMASGITITEYLP